MSQKTIPQKTFDRLSPFIQEYIYNQGWQQLRDVQIAACQIIFETNAHLLLATGTASGKTEAAFLPILTLLDEEPPKTIGVLYISPIKALINDQFERLNDLLVQSHTRVFAWHGDIPSSRKRKLLASPSGILQITSESLESLLINHYSTIPRLFGDLRFVVIDEIHSFMDSERGYQILCQLVRLSRIINKVPRRVGLSATLGDSETAKKWLQMGTNLAAIAPEIADDSRKVRLAVEHFPLASEIEPTDAYYRYLFEITKNSKSLIFANSRTDTESVIANLRSLARSQNAPDIYHVHHGSISASLREDAETAMRSDTYAVTAATLTLELGIDLGQLERVIQLNSPLSVSSFLQRLGRTGRREMPADMRFICSEKEQLGDEFLPDLIPWQLLQTIAIIQLYLEDRWLEPIQLPKYSYSLLYHQTLSILASRGERSHQELANKVLSLPAFQDVSPRDFQQLLNYWENLEHLEVTENNTLILGLIGEKIVRNFQFYAVFDAPMEYIVRGEAGEIGSIFTPPPLGKQFSLAGRTWQVIDVDYGKRNIWVKPVSGIANIAWRGRGMGKIHTKILQKMRTILFAEHDYPYLLPGAKTRLTEARNLARRYDLDREIIHPLDRNLYCIFPWMGTKTFNTLEKWIYFVMGDFMNLKIRKSLSPYYLLLTSGEKTEAIAIQETIVNLCQQNLTSEDVTAFIDSPQRQKYDKFIPDNLLRQAFAWDYLDIVELQQIVKTW
ncbi:DEAD/DEAH box helicase [Spirulina sp. 06S082]|uniref:DEAD/DEAH box helicase n=1 Tax=Spirulina sp. 06S082 TaxID=3110248 RepID=UPI002B20F63E|nr:DEAD/DEAH box helicase [Spirulina sp. 06S082]MEA5468472.1 DEAD/DEAH box helicase [Spirulina sp. 06S082]